MQLNGALFLSALESLLLCRLRRQATLAKAALAGAFQCPREDTPAPGLTALALTFRRRTAFCVLPDVPKSPKTAQTEAFTGAKKL